MNASAAKKEKKNKQTNKSRKVIKTRSEKGDLPHRRGTTERRGHEAHVIPQSATQAALD